MTPPPKRLKKDDKVLLASVPAQLLQYYKRPILILETVVERVRRRYWQEDVEVLVLIRFTQNNQNEIRTERVWFKQSEIVVAGKLFDLKQTLMGDKK